MRDGHGDADLAGFEIKANLKYLVRPCLKAATTKLDPRGVCSYRIYSQGGNTGKQRVIESHQQGR